MGQKYPAGHIPPLFVELAADAPPVFISCGTIYNMRTFIFLRNLHFGEIYI